MSKKILIIEDEWSSIKGSFNMANVIAFKGLLLFDQKSKSQDVNFNELRKEYSAIFVDITLAKNTELDGYNILKKIVNEKCFDSSHIVVLTGNSKVQENLIAKGIDFLNMHFVFKPVDYNEIISILNKVIDKA